jgi:hypothetical protein
MLISIDLARSSSQMALDMVITNLTAWRDNMATISEAFELETAGRITKESQ